MVGRLLGMSVMLLFGCRTGPPDGGKHLAASAVEGVNTVSVTIDGDVSNPGTHQIPSTCDKETMYRAVGGWLAARQGGLTPKTFWLYRSAGNVTNSWHVRLKEMSTHEAGCLPFRDGDHIHVNRSIF
jgi:hypothetical protein